MIDANATRFSDNARRSVRWGSSLRQPEEYRLPTVFADVSNLDKDDKPFAGDDRR